MQPKLPFGNPAAPSARGPKVLSVREAVEAANRCLEQAIPPTWVEGEVTGLKLAASGHAYFTLKDPDAVLPAAMWRSSVRRLRFRLEEGQRLRVFGRMGIYTAQGRFQFYAERAEPAGVGDLMLALEQLKRRLEADGLFAADRKRELPSWPRVVGVVTSPGGAVIHDIARVIRRRCPTRILLSPSAVQGEGAAEALVRALARLQAIETVDVIIIGRGGGSLEDLWCFNDEALARAVATCRVPVVSAVGHEVDVSVCDLVADVRASTPSQAGELVVPDRRVLEREFDSLERRLRLACERRILDGRARLEEASHRLERKGRALLSAQRSRLAEQREELLRLGRGLGRRQRGRIVELERRLANQHPQQRIRRDRRRLVTLETAVLRHGGRLTANQRLRLANAAGKLDALSPLAVLERGYSVVTRADGSVVSDAREVEVGDRLAVRLDRGTLEVDVAERAPGSTDKRGPGSGR